MTWGEWEWRTPRHKPVDMDELERDIAAGIASTHDRQWAENWNELNDDQRDEMLSWLWPSCDHGWGIEDPRDGSETCLGCGEVRIAGGKGEL